MNTENEQERIQRQIDENIKGHEIPAPEREQKKVEPAQVNQNDPQKDVLLNSEGTPEREDLIKRINHTLNKIRPYLQADGGDVHFVDYKDHVVTVTMSGACSGCMLASADISEGVQAILVDEIPEVNTVHLVSTNPWENMSL